jgi:hypothetical protein
MLAADDEVRERSGGLCRTGTRSRVCCDKKGTGRRQGDNLLRRVPDGGGAKAR